MENSLRLVERFIDALVNEPSQSDLLSVLVREHLTEQKVYGIEVFQIENAEDLTPIFSYGKRESDSQPVKVSDLSEVFDVKDVFQDLEKHGFIHNFIHKLTLTGVEIQSVLRGFYLYKHESHYEINEEDTQFIKTLSKLMNMYCSIHASLVKNAEPHIPIAPGNPPELSARQLVILGGMLTGKTNDELSEQIGYSSSTIRHEAMAIYKILGVSNRADASRIARELGLI